MNVKAKNRFRFGISLLALFLSVATLIALLLGVFAPGDSTKSLKWNDYERGNVNEVGKVIESRQSMCSSELNNIDGLVVDIDEEKATITYKLAFYDEDGKYLSMTESLDKDFDNSIIPEGAEQFRVIITPLEVDGEPVEIGYFAMSKYASQLDVTFDE